MALEQSTESAPNPTLDLRGTIVRDSAAMAAAVLAGPLHAEVPGCPGWTLADLAFHMGWIQRWATFIVNNGRPPTAEEVAAAPTDPSLAAAYIAEGTAPLIAALDAADLDAPCWNFTRSNEVKGFWLRRQAHEVAAHRWDAEASIGDARPVEARIAADGIDEFVTSIIGRVVGRAKPDTTALVGDVHLHCTDTAGEWTFQLVDGALEVTTGHGKAAAAVRGAASDLLLFLYNRIPADRVEIFGDRALVDNWMSVLRI